MIRLLLFVLLMAVPWTGAPSAAAQGGVGGQPLFQGVTYFRDERAEPRPLVLHVVTVDLTAPGISLFVTPGDTPGSPDVLPRRTSAALANYGLQVAVNANYYIADGAGGLLAFLFPGRNPLRLLGLAVSGGVTYALEPARFPVLAVAADRRVTIGAPPEAGVMYAAAGDRVLLAAGQARSHAGQPQPRTAVALDEAGETLILVVVDGRRPGISEGVNFVELAAIIQQYGGWDAINLDGGGSSTLAVQGPDGAPRLLNTPIDSRIPGRERPVANHLGVYALPLADG